MAGLQSGAPRGPIALTMGEPSGIGPEIALKAWIARDVDAGPEFALIGDPALIAGRARHLDLDVPITEVTAIEDARPVFASALPVLPTGIPVAVSESGAPTPDNAASVIAAIDKGVELAISGEAAALVTNPIAKSILAAAGFAYPGHTNYLGALARMYDLPATPVMMLVGGGLRTIPVTVHIPLRDVPDALSRETIIETTRVAHHALIADFGIASPRLAVTGLNPHAGEDGAMGTEERDVIQPALDALSAEGLDIRGPLPADTAFHPAARARYDAILAMYHDQALIPVKTLAFDEGVNVTLGLPFVRTSPDHGTAFNIAGTGLARPDSLIAALKLAAQMAQTRAGFHEARG